MDLVFISDLHLRKGSGKVVDEIVRLVREINPYLIFLGGDYVENRAGLEHLGRLVTDLSFIADVIAVGGNHDNTFGVAAIEAIIVAAGGKWIEQETLFAGEYGKVIMVDGNRFTDREVEVLKVLISHKPVNLQQANEQHYDLVLAGHLHGGQMVLWQNEKGLYPARWFYRWNGLRYAAGNTDMIVSKGVSDTIPIRYNCRRDLLHIQVRQQNA